MGMRGIRIVVFENLPRGMSPGSGVTIPAKKSKTVSHGPKESSYEKTPLPPDYLLRAVEPVPDFGRVHCVRHRIEVHRHSPRIHHRRYLGCDSALLLCQRAPVTGLMVPDRQRAHLPVRLDSCQPAVLPLQPLRHGRPFGCHRPDRVHLSHQRADPGSACRRGADGRRHGHHSPFPGVCRRDGHCGHHPQPEIQRAHGYVLFRLQHCAVHVQFRVSGCRPGALLPVHEFHFFTDARLCTDHFQPAQDGHHHLRCQRSHCQRNPHPPEPGSHVFGRQRRVYGQSQENHPHGDPQLPVETSGGGRHVH
jgi:hypothetical protein